MGTYNSTTYSKLITLEDLLKKGKDFGFDFSELENKIAKVKASLNDGRIRIVLLSSFSEGKTSTIAGLLGRIEDNMKIDNDESSDEIVIYRPDGLAEGFEFVDTPGLFGKKEKEIDGKMVRFSEITEKYLSESHLILFICDAVNPLKESHASVVEQLLRKFHKLDSTIFVINKMDQAGIDLSDDNDFVRGADIKKATLIQRLKDTIDLTPEEESRLNVVCISADPDGEGIDKWLESQEEYKHYSHIEELRDKVNSVIALSDKDKLQLEMADASLVDITGSVSAEIKSLVNTIDTSLASAKEAFDDMSTDLDLLRKDLTQNKAEMTSRFKELKANIIASIDGASVDTINSVIENEIGVEGKDITFYIFNREVNQITKECSEANDVSINARAENINKQATVQEKVLGVAAKKASESLSKVKIDGEMIKSLRDIVAKDYKFAPWGAVNLGKNVTKAMNVVGKGLSVALEFVKWGKDIRDQKRLRNTQDKLKNVINEQMATIFKAFDNDDEYYKNFAPSYLRLQSETQNRNKDFIRVQRQSDSLKEYGHLLTKWALENAQDATIID